VIPDYSSAPRPSQKKPDATTSVVVMGDANADWLAYGLEDAFSEKPEFGVVRKHRTGSGLIRYGGAQRQRMAAGGARDHCGREGKIHRHDDRQQRPSADPREGPGGEARRAEGECATQPVDAELQQPEPRVEPAGLTQLDLARVFRIPKRAPSADEGYLFDSDQ
jgi:hypothetical protein